MTARGYDTLATLILVAILALVVLGAVFLAGQQCANRWRDSGMRSEYRWMGGGCFVETSRGRWISERHVREYPAPEVIGK